MRSAPIATTPTAPSATRVERRVTTAACITPRRHSLSPPLAPEYWILQKGIVGRADRDRALYDLWARQGLLTPTPGASIDYAFVAHQVAEISQQCDLRPIKFDRWRINDLQRELDRIDCTLPLEPHGQVFRDMTPALKRLEALALEDKLRHGGHLVLAWNASNAIATSDPAGGRKLDKSKATGRINGLVSLYQRALIRTHGPFSPSDGHDLPGLIDEFVPGFATQCDDFVVGLEYPVG